MKTKKNTFEGECFGTVHASIARPAVITLLCSTFLPVIAEILTLGGAEVVDGAALEEDTSSSLVVASGNNLARAPCKFRLLGLLQTCGSTGFCFLAGITCRHIQTVYR